MQLQFARLPAHLVLLHLKNMDDLQLISSSSCLLHEVRPCQWIMVEALREGDSHAAAAEILSLKLYNIQIIQHIHENRSVSSAVDEFSCKYFNISS